MSKQSAPAASRRSRASAATDEFPTDDFQGNHLCSLDHRHRIWIERGAGLGVFLKKLSVWQLEHSLDLQPSDSHRENADSPRRV